MKIKLFVLCLVLTGSACSNMYYGAMEKIGVHKREILVDRVGAARNSQMEAKEQFLTAMEQYKSLVHFQGGDLEKNYNKLSATLKRSESKAADVRDRIEAVEDVSQALFKEWRSEAGLSNELNSVQSNVDDLIRDIERAIAQADEFMASLQVE